MAQLEESNCEAVNGDIGWHVLDGTHRSHLEGGKGHANSPSC